MSRNRDPQYVVGRLPTKGRPLFEVKKFIGASRNRLALEATYQVTQIRPPVHLKNQDMFMCNCPNSKSGRHIDDKHGLMIKDWIGRGEPKTGYYNSQGVYHV